MAICTMKLFVVAVTVPPVDTGRHEITSPMSEIIDTIHSCSVLSVFHYQLNCLVYKIRPTAQRYSVYMMCNNLSTER